MSPIGASPGPEPLVRWIALLATVAALLHLFADPLFGEARQHAVAGPAGGARTWAPAGPPPPMARIPGGAYRPQYAVDGAPVRVASFRLDAVPVTLGEYLEFVRARPEWRRGRAPAVFAGDEYLAGWAGELDPGLDGSGLRRPVTGVTWFAARAFCSWRGARLPTTDEWEYAARAGPAPEPGTAGSGATPGAPAPGNPALFLRLYARRPAPDALPPVGRTFRNAYGLWDLHGLVWEWTSDFNNRMLTGAARDDRGLDRGLFCAAGAVGATDPEDYAAFLRWAFRTSLEGDDAGPLLGFRCAADGGAP